MLGKIEGRRRRGRQGMRWFNSITDSMNMNLSKFLERVKDREAWHAAVHRVTNSQIRLSNGTHTHTCDTRMTTEKVKAEHNSSSYLQFL